MGIRFVHRGKFEKATSFLEKLLEKIKMGALDKYGELGVKALSSATPKDSGATASSWGYEIVREGSEKVSIVWNNSNVNEGVNIAVILQLGHGTGTGGYVQGIDYINPAMAPIFESIANDAWKEVVG